MENNNSRLQNLMEKAVYHEIRNEYKCAIYCYYQVLQIDPKNINALNNMGFAYYNFKIFPKAIDCYDKVLQIDPKHTYALNNKGTAYYNLNEY